MHIARLYSNTLGQAIDKIYTYEKFFPIPIEKFIVFAPFSKPSKCYSYWREVLSLIYPPLEQHGIKILQVGQQGEQPLPFCLHAQGETTWGQLEYLVKHSQLVLSTDSISSHLAGAYNKPLVVLISNNFKECVKPLFGDSNRHIILEPDRTKKLPSFILDEGPIKQIDEIKPEDIASSVLKLLNIEWNYPYKTIKLGLYYTQLLLELVPNQNVNPREFNTDSIIVRMDYLFDERILAQQLSICKCVIVTNRPIRTELLSRFSSRIAEIIVEITEHLPPSFVDTIRRLGIKYRMISKLSADELNKLKLGFIDFGLIIPIDTTPFTEINLDELSSIYYKSSRFLLSSGQIYQSKYDWINHRPILSFEPTLQPLTPNNLVDLWPDKDYYGFFKKTK